MPKTNAGGATYAGHEGLVVDGEGKVSELDPSRNADGTVVDGYESDERDLKDRDPGESPAEIVPIEPPADSDDETVTERDEDDKEVTPSAGTNFSTSSKSPVSETKKTSTNRR